MNNKGLTLIEVIIVAAIVMILGAMIVPKFIGINIEYSDGERTGVVTKISKKGMMWKTYEGQMNLGGMSADAGGVMTPNVWDFSATDPAVVKQIEDAANTAKRITIKYSQKIAVPLWEGSTNYIAVSVR